MMERKRLWRDLIGAMSPERQERIAKETAGLHPYHERKTVVVKGTVEEMNAAAGPDILNAGDRS